MSEAISEKINLKKRIQGWMMFDLSLIHISEPTRPY